MRLLSVVLTSVVALLASSACAAPSTQPTRMGPTHLQTAAISTVAKPVPVPEPRYTRTMYASTQLAGAAVMLDACAGPIAIQLGARWPVLIAQHDYCGGSGWMPKLNVGDAVSLKGDGVQRGVYVVTETRYQLRGKAKVSDLPGADAVLQTCISKTELVMVGLNWVGFSPTPRA